ncbi:alpha/beta hydrolase [Pseudorhodoplanes sp.]|uniref:alpha/beta fold hydrolase n=1 Tax=Pseudorhodoplanes sp. TaxID=1934341 RepID=UPI002C456532|nr:alpha/beta hydrolase [Pseudorhodoplanes sp.]HWV52550.1 alpha/beta hydrolase [Pseudorhodoplanes sp.]
MPGRGSVDVQSRFFAAPDGLSLHVRCYEPEGALRLPVLCLPGLTRNEADFEPLARYLSADSDRPRRVYALDSRGRGRSAYDPDWRNYNPAIELADVVAVAAALDLGRAIFVGTSRGGILTMLMAAVKPSMIAGAVLNDIGPVIEPAGLMRIKGYAGRMQRPNDLQHGAAMLRDLFGTQFPNLTESDWLAWATRNWREDRDGLLPRYDQALAETLKDLRPDQPMPDLWPQFEALPQVPLMVVRGMLSDILSADTLRAMQGRRADLQVVEVSDQGHAPLLAEPVIMEQIAEFMQRCDDRASQG